MVVRIGELVHESTPDQAQDRAAAPAAAAGLSPAQIEARALAAIRREASRRERLWAD